MLFMAVLGTLNLTQFHPKKYRRATDLAIMYLEYRAKFWGRCRLCAYVRQTSVPNIAGFSSNQDSILGTN